MRPPAVSAVARCAEPLTDGRRYVTVHLLTGQRLYFSVDPKSRLTELFTGVAEQMCLQGMQDPDLFGLAVMLDGEYVFVDPENKIGKYAPKAWKASQTNGLDNSKEPLLQFSFRVKFYVECHLLLRDPVSRHHYYLQLRENVLVHRQSACSQEGWLLLAGWALQADMGNCPESASGPYFQPTDYFPKWLIARLGVDAILSAMPSVHRENTDMPRGEAEMAYIREASSMEAPHNLHIYRLKRRKSDQTGTVLLGICPNGIELYQEEKNNVRKLMASFVWTNISKLSFEKKRFEISALTQKFTFYTNNDEKSKHLFHLCKQIHLFTQSVKERLAALRQRTEDERRSLAGSLQYASGLHSGWEYLHKDGKSIDQRVSVISNTSSNTTSGIVSDRTVQSLDESDDDMRLETLINSGPAESVESGMDSLTRSLSQLDAASLRSSQKSPADDSSSTLAVPPPGPRSEPATASTGGSPGVEGSPASGSAPPDVSRAGSAHSSSSQHSSSTVRSRYSLTKLTAHQTVDIDDEGDETPGRGRIPPFSASSANCCSTCVEDDAASECSEARDRARQCACGAAADGASLASGSTLYTLQGGSPRSRRAASGSESLSRSHRSQSSVASVASTADSTRAVDSDAQGDSSVYDYASASSSAAAPEYVDFYRPAAAEAAARGAPSGDSASVRSGASLASAASSGGAATLDYSVHSAHTSVGSVITTPGTFPGKTTVSDTLDTDSDYVQVPYDRLGQFRLSEAPMGGVAMETVTTVTPVCVAQSCQTTDAEETPQAPPPAAHRGGVSSQATSAPVPIVPRGMSSVAPPSSATPSSQAPARLVTTLPMVTVFTAHVYPAVTQSARFAAAPARLRVSAAPARPKPMVARPEAQALMRSTSHEAGLVIGGNNYLDVRASHPALSPALRPLEQATAPPRTSGLATVYINQVTRSQIEQFERQLLSDSDYVIYPHKDPAISRQEYVDAKHCSLVAGGPPAGLPPPPPYRAPHTAAHYRSSPNVAGPYAATTLVPPPPGPYAISAGLAHYGSVQALSDRLDGLRHARHHLSSHSLASSAAGSDPMSAPTPADAELLRAALLAGGRRSSGVLRAKSDENLLSAGASERRPERPPPPYWQTQPRLQGVPSPSLNQLNQPSVVQQHQLQQQQKLQQLQQQQLRQQQQQLQQEQMRQQQQQQLQQEQLKQQQQQLIQQQLFQQQLLQQKQQAQQNQQLLKQQQQQQQQLQQQQQQKQLEEHAQQTQQQQHRQTLEKHQLLVRQQQQQQRQQQQQTEQQLEEQVQQQKQQQQRQTLEKHQLLIRQHLERIQQLSPAPSGGGSSGVGGSTPLQSAQSHNRLPSAASDDLDIDGLRAASHQMDLPLIQALCHDRLLRRPPNGRPKTWHEAQVTSSSSSPAPSQAPTPGPGPRPLPAHPAAGQPLLAKHKSLGLPAFPEQRRAPVTSAAGAQLMAALERRAPATSHRHPQPQPQQSQQQLKTVAKRDPRAAPVR